MSANEPTNNYWNNNIQSNPPYAITDETYGNNVYSEEPQIGIESWILIFFILVIPVVNIIMLISWSLKKNINPTKKAFSRAYLFWMLVIITIILVLSVVFYDTFNYEPTIDKIVNIFKYIGKKVIERFK